MHLSKFSLAKKSFKYVLIDDSALSSLNRISTYSSMRKFGTTFLCLQCNKLNSLFQQTKSPNSIYCHKVKGRNQNLRTSYSRSYYAYRPLKEYAAAEFGIISRKKVSKIIDLTNDLRHSARNLDSENSEAKMNAIILRELASWPGKSVAENQWFAQEIAIKLLKENNPKNSLAEPKDKNLFPLIPSNQNRKILNGIDPKTSNNNSSNHNLFMNNQTYESILLGYIEHIKKTNAIELLVCNEKWMMLFIELIKISPTYKIIDFAIETMAPMASKFQNAFEPSSLLEIVLDLVGLSHKRGPSFTTPSLGDKSFISWKVFISELWKNQNINSFLENQRFNNALADLTITLSKNDLIIPYQQMAPLYNFTSVTGPRKITARGAEKFMSQVLLASCVDNSPYFEDLFTVWVHPICQTLGTSTVFELVNPRSTPHEFAPTVLDSKTFSNWLCRSPRHQKVFITYFYSLSQGNEISRWQLHSMLDNMVLTHKAPKALLLFYHLIRKAGKEKTSRGLEFFKKYFLNGSNSEYNTRALLEFNSGNFERTVGDELAQKAIQKKATSPVYPSHTILLEIICLSRSSENIQWIFKMLFSHMIQYSPQSVMPSFSYFVNRKITTNSMYSAWYKMNLITLSISKLESMNPKNISLQSKLDCFSSILSKMGLDATKVSLLATYLDKRMLSVNSNVQELVFNRSLQDNSYYYGHLYAVNLFLKNEFREIVIGLVSGETASTPSQIKSVLKLYSFYQCVDQPSILVLLYDAILKLSMRKKDAIMDNFLFQEMSSVLLDVLGTSSSVSLRALNRVWENIIRYSRALTQKAEKVRLVNHANGINGGFNSISSGYINYNLIPNYSPKNNVGHSYIAALLNKGVVYKATYMALFCLPSKLNYRISSKTYILLLNHVSKADPLDGRDSYDYNLFSFILNQLSSCDKTKARIFLNMHKSRLSVRSKMLIESVLSNTF